MVLLNTGKLIFWIGLGFSIPSIVNFINIQIPEISILLFQFTALIFSFVNIAKIIYIINEWVK